MALSRKTPYEQGGGAMKSRRDLEMRYADLLGYSEKDVACHQCSSCCGERAGRVMDGKPLIMCTRKEATREVLSHMKRRAK